MLRGNRFRLITLGRLALVGPAGDEDASLGKRRFKLALLAVLAIARRPLARDVLLEMFWGEHDEARARHSLSNALSSLRRALGQRAIATRGTDVALDTETPLDVDALDLAAAMEGGDAGRAVELYGGPFLHGMHVDESPAFDQWAFRERRRLESIFLKACAQHCATLARTRRWPECAVLAARWIDTEPLSSDAAIFLLNAIKAPGTRAALAQAVDEYERLRIRLAREFELMPEPAVRELADRIREQLSTMEPPPVEEPAPAVSVADDAPLAVQAIAPPVEAESFSGDVVTIETTPSDPSLPLPPIERAPGRRPFWRSAAAARVFALSMVVLALSLVANRTSRVSNGVASITSRKPVIAVFAMDVRSGDSALTWLADGLPHMIAGKLAHNSAIDVAPAAQVSAVIARSGHSEREPLTDAMARDLARRIGATLVARGSIGRDGTNLVVDFSVQDVESGRLVRNDVLTRSDALAIADEAAVRILGAANVSASGAQIADLESSSLEAYQHFMRGLEAGQVGRLSESKKEFDAAIALDSGFITALRARIGMATGEQDTLLVNRLRETMRRHYNRATDFDRLAEEASDAVYAGERERSEALGRGLVRRYPRDPRAYELLENILELHGQFAEAGLVAKQSLALDSLAMEAGTGPCAQCIGFFHTVNLHWMRNDMRGAADWARRWIRAQPDAPSAWAALAWSYSYMQRPDSALSFMRRAVSLSGGEFWAREEVARMLLVARRYAAADSAIALLEINPPPERRESAFDLRSLLEREHGRYRASTRVMDRLIGVAPASSGFVEMMRADNLRALGSPVEAARRYETSAHFPASMQMHFPLPSTIARGFCWHHALAADAYAQTGDTVTLHAKADTLEAACSRSYYGRDWKLYHHVRGLVALRGHRYVEAERELTQAIWAPVEAWSRSTVALAEAQIALGLPRSALATLRAAYATRLDAMGHYVPISELDFRMAETFARLGERDSVQTYAGYVRTAWRDADPEIRRLLDRLP